MTSVAVLGAGSWGTAFGLVVAEAGCSVRLLARETAVADDIRGHHLNSAYHPGVILPPTVDASTDPGWVLADADIVVLAVPAQVLRGNLRIWAPLIPPDAVLVSLMKGIELGTSMRMSEVIAESVQADPARVAVVSGPNLAAEIAARQPTATIVACSDEGNAKRLQDACVTSWFRPYRAGDVIGTEIAGAVKNVIALANGMAVGMSMGENAQASLITRGLAEMSRLGVALGGDLRTFIGLAGVGDLLATCHSPLSRNRTFGENLGRGLSVAEVEARTLRTCEGVKSCASILELARRAGVDMPITEEVVQVVHHGLDPGLMLGRFMSRSTKPEH